MNTFATLALILIVICVGIKAFNWGDKPDNDSVYPE